MKQRITITVDRELLKVIDEKVDDRTFANRSHAIEYLIAQEKDEE